MRVRLAYHHENADKPVVITADLFWDWDITDVEAACMSDDDITQFAKRKSDELDQISRDMGYEPGPRVVRVEMRNRYPNPEPGVE